MERTTRKTRSKRVFSPYLVTREAPHALGGALLIPGLDFGAAVEQAFDAADSFEDQRPFSPRYISPTSPNPPPAQSNADTPLPSPSSHQNASALATHSKGTTAGGNRSESKGSPGYAYCVPADTPHASQHSQNPASLHQKLKRRRKRTSAGKPDESRRVVAYEMRESALRKRSAARFLKADLLGSQLPHARGAWVGRRRRATRGLRALSDPKLRGYEVFQWDGRESFFILDPQHTVVAHLAGRPKRDETWDGACIGVAHKLVDIRRRMNPTADDFAHRRGRFATLRARISYGGGQTHPQNTDLGKHAALVEEILQDPNVERISGFANSSFAFGAPKPFVGYPTDSEPSAPLPFRTPR
ncbi:hypothetical protein BV25DRAFT_1918437 [Artomyces pyxidatus]|uniref:Uncharacterized protein n=1 Tax=Artomyces pyxidatus TaxID=48021 RepID=A0ACB8SUB0_9AGAM|nr:hypothetical protein BV25DRAFT_1918437 [Artomyces pyxidatus]